MPLLGIETSTEVSSVALWSADGALASSEHPRPRGHVEFLMPAISALLDGAGRTLRDLTGVAVGLGPGSFSGLRAGIATAKALAQALGIPVAAVSSLDVLAAGEPGRVCATIDARRGEVYAALYREGVRESEPALWTPDALRAEGARFVGTGPLVDEPSYPSAGALCRLAIGRAQTTPVALVEPLYVRRTDAEITWETRGVVIERPFRVKTAKR